jgi:hypothetical protein
MRFNELNSVAHFIIHQLSGVHDSQFANREYRKSQSSIYFVKTSYSTGVFCNIANRDTQYK